MGTPRSSLPPELQNVATSEDLNTLESKVLKCYSAERYEEFEAAVEKILLKALEMDSTQEKLGKWVQNEVNQALSNRWWKNFSFWIPTLIAAAAVGVAIFK